MEPTMSQYATKEDYLIARAEYYKAQCDELLKALKRLEACYSSSHSPETRQDCWGQAKEAIKNSEMGREV